MKILTVLTYYRPHTSGLTIYAERLARALVRRGHQVTVLTSQYERNLPSEEMVDGVRIVRAPVLARISKGVIMPTFGWLASRMVQEHDAVLLHLPQFDAAGVALRGRIWKKPTLITYHCDLLMPPGWLSQTAAVGVHLMNHLAAQFTHGIITYTRDYGENSPYLQRYQKKIHVIPPPVEMPIATSAEREAFGRIWNPEQFRPVIGMAARFASEKGVEVLLKALPEVMKQYPQALVLFAGPYQNILGEETYWKRLEPVIQEYQARGHWKFVGILNPNEMAAFYPNLDLLVLPSLNSTESFGLVQIEAMLNDVPSVASDLPGVRQPVMMHRKGRIIPIGDAPALASAICELVNLKYPSEGLSDMVGLSAPHFRAQDKEMPTSEWNEPSTVNEIREAYDPENIAQKYEELIAEIRRGME